MTKEFEKLKDKVKKVMSKHIGEENAIHSTKFFRKVYGQDPEDFDIYERRFMWEVILKINSKLRVSNELFIVTKYNKSFVLKTLGEKNGYHKVQDARIESIKNLKRNSDEWIRNKMWKKHELVKVKRK